MGDIKNIVKRKKSGSDPVFGDKYLKTKIKYYNKKVTIIFYDKSHKEGLECLNLSQ